MQATSYTIGNYSTREINRNFKMKLSGFSNSKGKKVNTLVGVKGLVEELGIELALDIIERAFNCTEDKLVRKLRRGLRVSFYVH